LSSEPIQLIVCPLPSERSDWAAGLAGGREAMRARLLAGSVIPGPGRCGHRWPLP
jgi:hypothetical protein